MKLFGSLAIPGKGMTAQRTRLDLIAANIANRESIGYKPQHATFAAEMTANGRPGGVTIASIIEDERTQLVYDPENPQANAEGYISLPEVDVVAEFTDLLASQRSYQLNSQVFQSVRSVYSLAIGLMGRR